MKKFAAVYVEILEGGLRKESVFFCRTAKRAVDLVINWNLGTDNKSLHFVKVPGPWHHYPGHYRDNEYKHLIWSVTQMESIYRQKRNPRYMAKFKNFNYFGADTSDPLRMMIFHEWDCRMAQARMTR